MVMRFFRAFAADFVALVSEDSVASLQVALKTEWAFLTYESRPSAEDLAKVAFMVPRLASGVEYIPPNNRVLQLPMTGYDHLNFSDLPPSWTVAIVHQAGTPIAEYALLNMLNWNIGQTKQEETFRRCTWQTKAPGNSCKMPPRHKELNGQTLGIVGYGHIGSAIASRAAAFNMTVCAIDVHPQDPLPPSLSWMGDDSQLPRLMKESDFVVVAVPLLPSTLGMINSSTLAFMKRTAVLINVARGAVVDEDSLYNALKSKEIGGAILDVWWHEWAWRTPGKVGPEGWPAEHDFSVLDNVVMTPHFSSDSEEARADALVQVAANMDHFSRGEPLDYVVRNGSMLAASFI
eukprot:CAMPEP_0117508834 /NCGR_PEP_ID=MMETSP0784-20121206/27155_1 /TAXON_ID=39447 /ORGANISM="" /LENGTH=346 /DNA_ID=CAMNT_0005304405 /DNA_START=84 /DNA_END=1124 /DNA_ORIENTATION=+